MAFKLIMLFFILCVGLATTFLAFRVGRLLGTPCKHDWKLKYECDSELDGQVIGVVEVYQCIHCKKSMRKLVRYVK